MPGPKGTLELVALAEDSEDELLQRQPLTQPKAHKE